MLRDSGEGETADAPPLVRFARIKREKNENDGCILAYKENLPDPWEDLESRTHNMMPQTTVGYFLGSLKKP